MIESDGITANTVKVGVNIPVVPPALQACIDTNTLINSAVPGAVSFGPVGNSSPHVTIAMGLIQKDGIDALVEVLTRLTSKLEDPLRLEFSKPYRETVTRRYVLSDVTFSEDVQAWRLMARDRLSGIFLEPARTSDEAHLTLGLAESNAGAVDRVLVGASEIPPCVVDCLHVSTSGSKGIKTAVLAEVRIATS